MKVKAVSVTNVRKIPITQYGSLESGGTVWADVEDGEDYNDVMDALADGLRKRIKAEFEALPKPLRLYYALTVQRGLQQTGNGTATYSVDEVAKAFAEIEKSLGLEVVSQQ